MLKCTARCPLVMTSCKERDTTFIRIYKSSAARIWKVLAKMAYGSLIRSAELLSDCGKWRDNDSRGCWTDKKMPRRVYFSRNRSLSLSFLSGPFHIVHSQNVSHTSMCVCPGVMYLPVFFAPAFFVTKKSANGVFTYL